MSITRLIGGLTPADGSDPRTFPVIWNTTADLIESIENDVDDRAPLLLTESVKTANYTLALADIATVVAVNSSSNLTITVPTNASVTFPVGSVVNVYRAGAGTVTVEGASGVTVRNEGDIGQQYGEVSLRKRATDEWVLVGDVT
jgi:hypothetical protein